MEKNSTLGRKQSHVIKKDRLIMKAYAARDYKDITHRINFKVQVNVPEYMPTVPQDDTVDKITLNSGYFVNENYPVTAGLIEADHALELPILAGTRCPVRFNKGAEFLLIFPTGKVDEGFLMFIRDKEKEKKEG